VSGVGSGPLRPYGGEETGRIVADAVHSRR